MQNSTISPHDSKLPEYLICFPLLKWRVTSSLSWNVLSHPVDRCNLSVKSEPTSCIERPPSDSVAPEPLTSLEFKYPRKNHNCKERRKSQALHFPDPLNFLF